MTNYQLETDRIIASLDHAPTLLLHACCAPCSSYVLEYLAEHFNITVFFYNPNITENEEYEKRKNELKRLIAEKPFRYPVKMIDGDYSPQIFFDMANGMENVAEGGERCFLCYEIRLRETARLAKELDFEYFCTTLSVSPHKNAAKLNELGGKHGIGIVDIVENRVVGMKSRGVYETPGGTILYEAHQQLEELILDRETSTMKLDMGNKFAQIVYEGKWFTPLREAVQAFVDSTQEYVTGEVKFKLYKGNIIKAGTTSPYSLYNESIASFTTGDLYDHHDAEGFINLFGLSSKVRAMKHQEIEKNK